MCANVCIYAFCTYVRMIVNTHEFVYVYNAVYIDTYVHVCRRKYVRKNVYTFACNHVRAYVFM